MEKETEQRQEFLQLFLKQESELRAFIGTMVRDVHAREDLLQEISLTLWEAFDRFDSSKPFSAWSRGIAANKLRQLWNTSKRTAVAFSPEAINAIVDAFDRRERSAPQQLEALERCVELLPDKSRRLMILRYGESLTMREIADKDCCTLASLYKAMDRIRKRLRGCVERRLVTGELHG